MAEHAVFSPSSAARHLACTRSLILERQFADQRSCFAEEGTIAHELAAHKLKSALGKDSEKPVSDYIDDEMKRAIDDYGRPADLPHRHWLESR